MEWSEHSTAKQGECEVVLFRFSGFLMDSNDSIFVLDCGEKERRRRA